MISLLNDYLVEICKLKFIQEDYFDIHEKDDLINRHLQERLSKWKFKSSLHSKRWFSK